MRKAEVQMPPQKGREHGLNVAPPSPGIPSKRAKVSGDQTEPDSVDPVHPQPTPPVFIRRMRNAAVGTGCDIRLKVAVAGDPQPTLQWYHNDLLLESESQEYGGLWIRDCKPSDAGLYTCVATNSLGEARSSAVLAVLDLGEDSENTEDEAAEVHMEAKEGLRGPRKQAALGLPTGEGEGPPDRTSDLSSETDRWGPRQEMIIEKEVQTLGSRAPGLQDPLKPSRSKSEDVQKLPSPKVSLPIKSSAPSHIGQAPTDSHASCKKAPLPTSYVDTVPGDLEENLKQPKPSSVSQCSSQGYSPHTPLSEYSRKEALSRPRVFESSKVFEKVRLFEDGRRSEDNNEGSISGRSWAGFNRASSIDSDDGGSRWGISRESSKEDLQGALKADAAKKRSMFRQKVASLEDKSHYSQKVQDIENKFTEELQRIKKIVGKSHMRKSFSTEQLSQRSRQPLRKLEPIPPQVLQKLEDRERIQKLQELELKKPAKQQGPQISSILLKDPPFYGDTPAKHPQEETNREEPATLGAMPIAELPGQPLQGKTIRSNKMTYAPQKSSPPEASLKTRHQTSNTHPQKETSPPKMLEQRAEHQTTSPPLQNRLSLMQGESAKAPPGLNKLQDFSSSVPTDVREEEKMEVEATTPLSDVRFHIPTIIIEENPMEKDIPPASEKQKRDQYVKEGRTQRSRGKIHRTRPMSPELDSSDDSYMSAGEDTHEAPMFEYPLQDTVASSGSEVLLKCIIGGNPLPEVTWKKDGTEIANSLAHMIKVEGERHSLLIICANPSDAGTYHITAVNDAGRTSCSATLFIRSELTKEQQNLGVPSDINSPITSDEEYLSPLEEVMDSGTSTCQGREHLRMLDTRFKEPPTFQVSLSDQLVGIEGKEVVMSVQVKGQPKPMIYWLRDRVTIKIDTRHLVHETDEGCFEMKIISAQKSDTGMYTCKIINEYGTKQCECFLEVRAPPLEPVLAVLQRVNDVTVKAGESALFECHMTGPSDVDVDWLSNGKLIQPALLDCKMLFDGKTCRLLLSSVHEDDSGTYTCKLSTARASLSRLILSPDPICPSSSILHPALSVSDCLPVFRPLPA